MTRFYSLDFASQVRLLSSRSPGRMPGHSALAFLRFLGLMLQVCVLDSLPRFGNACPCKEARWHSLWGQTRQAVFSSWLSLPLGEINCGKRLGASLQGALGEHTLSAEGFRDACVQEACVWAVFLQDHLGTPPESRAAGTSVDERP